MKKDSFLFEFIKSGPFKVFIALILLIAIGVYISKCQERKVQMKEDVIYIHPKPKV
jgi:uncharacterized membrane protein